MLLNKVISKSPRTFQSTLQEQAIHTQWNRLDKTIRRLLFRVAFRDQVHHMYTSLIAFIHRTLLFILVFSPSAFLPSFKLFVDISCPFSPALSLYTHTPLFVPLYICFLASPFLSHLCLSVVLSFCLSVSLSLFLSVSVSPCIGTVWEAGIRPEWGQIKTDSSAQYIRKQSGWLSFSLCSQLAVSALNH